MCSCSSTAYTALEECMPCLGIRTSCIIMQCDWWHWPMRYGLFWSFLSPSCSEIDGAVLLWLLLKAKQSRSITSCSANEPSSDQGCHHSESGNDLVAMWQCSVFQTVPLALETTVIVCTHSLGVARMDCGTMEVKTRVSHWISHTVKVLRGCDKVVLQEL